MIFKMVIRKIIIYLKVESDENIDYTLTRQPKMYSLVIERENKRKLIDCEFDFKSNLKRTSAVQFDKNQECFL